MTVCVNLQLFALPLCVMTRLLDVSIVGSIDELLQLGQAVGLGQSEDQLRLHVGLAGLLAGHLQELDQVLPVSCKQNEQADLSHSQSHAHSPLPCLGVRAGTSAVSCLTTLSCSLSHLHVGGRVVGLDVGVDGLFDQTFLQLGLGQLTPHWRLVAALGELVSSVQVTNVLDQDLQQSSKE